MDVLRVMDAYCASCDDIHGHSVMDDDPSSCFCNRCGTGQPLVEPVRTWGSLNPHRRWSV